MPDLDSLLDDRPEFGLDELADVANALLPDLLPDDPVDARVKAEVNPRLVRHYVSEGLLDPSLREGKRAVYTVDHLLQLLALRRLLADGLSSALVGETLREKDRESLRAIAEGGGSDFAASPPAMQEPLAIDPRERARAALAAIRGESPGADVQTFASSPPTSFSGAVHRAPAPSHDERAEDVESWDRLPLFDGVELHVRSDVRLPSSLEARQRLLDHVVREIVRHAQRRER